MGRQLPHFDRHVVAHLREIPLAYEIRTVLASSSFCAFGYHVLFAMDCRTPAMSRPVEIPIASGPATTGIFPRTVGM